MTTKDKYYTPEAGELTIGMEVELLHSTNGWVKYINPDIKPLDANSLKEGVRVKYLDREDIESLGWEYYKTHPGTEEMEFEKGEYELTYDPNFRGKQYLRIAMEGDVTLFSGTIKNKSELINQLKRCGI
tara:strand:- start:31429 stop:31815 length:387 start_codon:yes stop_codon:yes gene_type:complete